MECRGGADTLQVLTDVHTIISGGGQEGIVVRCNLHSGTAGTLGRGGTTIKKTVGQRGRGSTVDQSLCIDNEDRNNSQGERFSEHMQGETGPFVLVYKDIEGVAEESKHNHNCPLKMLSHPWLRGYNTGCAFEKDQR